VKALSGGQQQRVAVARALAVGPKLLLLDEPFSALDRKLRETMQIELKRLLRELGTTAVFVTHDQDEALIMSDRIAVMNRGLIEQLATPDTIYRRPATAFALEFVGLSTRLRGKVSAMEGAGELLIDTAFGSIRANGNHLPGSSVLIGVRPERMVFGARDGANTVAAAIQDIVFQGSRIQVHFVSGIDEPFLLETGGELPAGLAPGQQVPLSWSIADTLVYPAGPSA
jgi:putative spermidine/putrescine transport system ATP-binding protein